MARRRQRKCRACKKRPVWRGGDVKNPGPFCKRCYHKRELPARWHRIPQTIDVGLPGPDVDFDDALPEYNSPDYDHCPDCGAPADVCGGGICVHCNFDFTNALYWWFA